MKTISRVGADAQLTVDYNDVNGTLITTAQIISPSVTMRTSGLTVNFDTVSSLLQKYMAIKGNTNEV